MGVSVDAIQARVAANALAREHAQSLNDELGESKESMRCKSRWQSFRKSTKRFYKTYADAGRGVLWCYRESGRKKQRVAIAIAAYIDGEGSRLRGTMEVLRQAGCKRVEQVAGLTVFVSQHAIEAMFRKAQRLHRGEVLIDVRQAIGSLMLMACHDKSYLEPGPYEEYEVLTESGVAFAVRDPDAPIFTITTWVPSHQLRDEQRDGWAMLRQASGPGFLMDTLPRALPRVSKTVHRSALIDQRYSNSGTRVRSS
jgi:hypothetical protein